MTTVKNIHPGILGVSHVPLGTVTDAIFSLPMSPIDWFVLLVDKRHVGVYQGRPPKSIGIQHSTVTLFQLVHMSADKALVYTQHKPGKTKSSQRF